MDLSTFHVLVGVAGILAIVSLIKPQWPLVSVAMLLICVALFIGKK